MNYTINHKLIDSINYENRKLKDYYDDLEQIERYLVFSNDSDGILSDNKSMVSAIKAEVGVIRRIIENISKKTEKMVGKISDYNSLVSSSENEQN